MEDFYMKEGTRKLQVDMDVVSIVRMAHNVDIMLSVLFSRFQQMALKFQRRLVIDSATDTSDSENDRTYTRRR